MTDSKSGQKTGSRQADDESIAEDSGLKPAEITMLRERLLEERDAVRERMRSHLDSMNDGDRELPDEMDQATRDQELGLVLRIADKERKLLMELDRALAKIEDGSYGLCEGTGEPIGVGRLKARPWARYGVAYKEQLEREEREEKLRGG